MNTLYGIPYSPWSEKARWALTAAKVPYREVTYVPMVGEAVLRAKLKQWTGRVSVPVLLTAEGPVRDSLEIARWASRHGESLFPTAAVSEIEAWNRRSEEALDAGRARTTLLVSRDPDAMLENLPRPLRRLGPASKALGRAGVLYLERKYGFGGDGEEALTARIRAALQPLQSALQGREYLVDGRFTHADITMAVALQVVRPPPHIRVGRLSRRHWTNDALSAEFPELLAWRDQLIARHRQLPVS